MNKIICRMALALAVASLAGCGLKGPLYFPPQAQPKQQNTANSDPTSATIAQPSVDATSTDRDGETSSRQSSATAGTESGTSATETDTQSAQ